LYSPRQLRIFFALGAVIAAGGLAAAEVGNPCSHAVDAATTPSKLDYMVLASFVDSPHLLAMASYRSTAVLPAAGAPGAVLPAAEVARP
jgi:hypothetical protein